MSYKINEITKKQRDETDFGITCLRRSGLQSLRSGMNDGDDEPFRALRTTRNYASKDLREQGGTWGNKRSDK